MKAWFKSLIGKEDSAHALSNDPKETPADRGDHLEVMQNEANALRSQGDLEVAELRYRQALALDPDFYPALLGLGLVLLDTARAAESIALLERAHVLRPDRVDPLFLRGLAEGASEHAENAASAYEACLALEPDFVPALEKVLPLLTKNDPARALALIRAALARNPASAQLHLFLALVFEEQMRYEEALVALGECLQIEPQNVSAWLHRAIICNAMEDGPGARAASAQVLRLAPELSRAHTEAARAALLENDRSLALAHARRASELDASDALPLLVAGYAMRGMSGESDTLALFAAASRIDAESVAARWGFAMSQIPPIFETAAQVAVAREHFDRELALLDAWFDRASRISQGVEVVGTLQPFYLAYQERDNRSLLARYGELCVRLMADWQLRQAIASAARPRAGRIRIGVVSQYFCDHSVWIALLKGWVLQLDRTQFELHVFALGAKEDEETSIARAAATSFMAGAHPLVAWCKAIRNLDIEALIYPDVGMDVMTGKLAALRLAPLQLAAWGHPETTGLATIDVYLSAEAFETPHSHQYYTEELVPLPGLGCCYSPLAVEHDQVALGDFGIAQAQPVLLCPGAPFKYAPECDGVWVEIARRLGSCQLVFFNYKPDAQASEQLARRLRVAFSAAGLPMDDFVVFAPWLSRPKFYALMRQSDVFLDTIGFSGFNTAMQAIEAGLPIVTREGLFMRGRLASGILKGIGLDELVAATNEGYVDLAVRLVRDLGYREEIRQRIASRREALFGDKRPVRALEKLLHARCR